MLLRVDQAPQYMREDSITTGYRKKLSYKACLSRYLTLFLLTNSDMNCSLEITKFLGNYFLQN